MLRTVSDGRSWPPRGLQRRRFKLWDQARQWLAREVEVRGDSGVYRFRCDSLLELSRSMGLFTKEPGTCAWIANYVAEGEVFYDIGANVGVYSVLAGHRVGATGKVVAFEPHCANFARLLDNILANRLERVVTACSFALHDQDGVLEFSYGSVEAGTANSHLRNGADGSGSPASSPISEMKFAASVDRLIELYGFPIPHHIKLDVDGNEPLILRGMRRLLCSERKPRSVQVELDRLREADVLSFMQQLGYEEAERHHTKSGLKRIRLDQSPEDYVYNLLFRPADRPSR